MKTTVNRKRVKEVPTVLATVHNGADERAAKSARMMLVDLVDEKVKVRQLQEELETLQAELATVVHEKGVVDNRNTVLLQLVEGYRQGRQGHRDGEGEEAGGGTPEENAVAAAAGHNARANARFLARPH